MAMLDRIDERRWRFGEPCGALSQPVEWRGHRHAVTKQRAFVVSNAGSHALARVCQWLTRDLDFAFATLIVEQTARQGWSLIYVFYREASSPWVHVELQLDAAVSTMPSVVGLVHGPSFDWHEREAEDLFGLNFEGHPRLGEFVLHEDWPEGINPMRRDFDAWSGSNPEPPSRNGSRRRS